MSDYLTTLLLTVIRPVHDGLMREFGVPASDEADCLSLAIKRQESGPNAVRDQGDPAVTGPATGLWQFEKTGGVWEVLNSPKIAPIFRDLCARVGIDPVADTVWRFFTTPQSDELAAAAARLVMYLDPAPLPPVSLSSAGVALDYYLRRWRPAKNPKREADFIRDAWPAAVRIIQANPRPAAGTPVQPVPAPAPLPVAPLPSSNALAAFQAELDRHAREIIGLVGGR